MTRGGFFFVGGGELAKLRDSGRDNFNGRIDLGGGGVTAEAETDAGARFGGGQADGSEDVRRLDRTRGTGCAGGAGEAFEIKRDDQGFAFDTGKSDVRGVGRARRAAGVGARIRDAGEQTLFEPIAQGGDAHGVFRERDACKFSGFAQADDASDIFRAGTESALVVPTIKKLAKARAPLDVNRANALGSVKLVTGKGKKIELESFDVDRNFPDGLHGISVEVDVALDGDAADFFEGLDGAEFIVGVHDGDEDGLGANGFAEIV